MPNGKPAPDFDAKFKEIGDRLAENFQDQRYALIMISSHDDGGATDVASNAGDFTNVLRVIRLGVEAIIETDPTAEYVATDDLKG